MPPVTFRSFGYQPGTGAALEGAAPGLSPQVVALLATMQQQKALAERETAQRELDRQLASEAGTRRERMFGQELAARGRESEAGRTAASEAARREDERFRAGQTGYLGGTPTLAREAAGYEREQFAEEKTKRESEEARAAKLGGEAEIAGFRESLRPLYGAGVPKARYEAQLGQLYPGLARRLAALGAEAPPVEEFGYKPELREYAPMAPEDQGRYQQMIENALEKAYGGMLGVRTVLRGRGIIKTANQIADELADVWRSVAERNGPEAADRFMREALPANLADEIAHRMTPGLARSFLPVRAGSALSGVPERLRSSVEARRAEMLGR